MAILLFIIILAVLIFVHELGHFLSAKKFGIKVKEFGIGFPPAIWKKKRGETLYTLNAIPFGGFVKIHGEDPEEQLPTARLEDRERNFAFKPKWIQVAVLAAGVFFNVVFAWLLISTGFVVGLPTPVSEARGEVINPRLVITLVNPSSPAQESGLRAGDSITAVSSNRNELKELTPSALSNFIEAHGNEEIKISYARGQNSGEVNVLPREGVIAGKKAIGIAMDTIGIQKLKIHQALWEGLKTTGSLITAIVKSLGQFITDAFRGQANVSSVTGPVGIVGLVGDVTELGFIYLLSFTAFISVNLAVINLLPFPALDGGRILFVLIEAVKGSPINPRVANALNAGGFIFLILLMIIVTIHDVVKLF